MSHSRRQLPPVDSNKKRERDEIFDFLRPSTAKKQPMSSPKLVKPKPLYPKDMALIKPSRDTCPPPLPASPRAVTLTNESRAFASPSRGNNSRATTLIKPTPIYPRLVGQTKSSKTDASASEPLSPRTMATRDVASRNSSRFAPYHPTAKSPRGAAASQFMHANSQEMASNKSPKSAHPPPMRASSYGTTLTKSSKLPLPLKPAYPRNKAPTNKQSKGATSLSMHDDSYRRTDPTKPSMHSSSRGMAPTKSSKDTRHPLPMHASSREIMAPTKSSKGTDPPSPPSNINIPLAGYFAHEYLTKGTLFGKPYGPTEAMASPVSWSSSSANIGTTKHSDHSYVNKGKGIALESESERLQPHVSHGNFEKRRGKRIAVESESERREPLASHGYADKVEPEFKRQSDKDLAYNVVSMMLKEGAHLKGIVNPSQLASLLNGSHHPEKK